MMTMKFCSIAVIIILLVGPALSQNPPTVEEITTTANDTIAVLQQQRNSALDQAVQLRAQMVKTERDLAKARQEIEALRRAAY
jgi:hypothetical protein